MTKKQNDQSRKTFERMIRSFATIVKEVGIPGFMVVFVASIFVLFASGEQKREFIDSYILIKNVSQNPFPCILVVLFLLVMLVLQNIYFTQTLKAKKEELLRCGKEKSELQQLLIKKRLNSSQ